MRTFGETVEGVNQMFKISIQKINELNIYLGK